MFPEYSLNVTLMFRECSLTFVGKGDHLMRLVWPAPHHLRFSQEHKLLYGQTSCLVR
jgi:hypothetical protein